jgi:PAS domain S-box-containing protein
MQTSGSGAYCGDFGSAGFRIFFHRALVIAYIENSGSTIRSEQKVTDPQGNMHSDYPTRLADGYRLQAVAATGLLVSETPAAVADHVRLTALALGAAGSAFLLLDEKAFLPRGVFGLPPSLAALPSWPLEWTFLLEAAFAGNGSALPTDGQGSGAHGKAGPAIPVFPFSTLPAFLGKPVEDAQGRCLGVLAVWDDKGDKLGMPAQPVRIRSWSETDAEVLSGLAALLGERIAGGAPGASAARGSETQTGTGAQGSPRPEIDSILKHLDTPVFAFGPDGKAVYANAAAARMVGVPDAADILVMDLPQIHARFDILDADLNPFPAERSPTLRALQGETVTGELVCYRLKSTGGMRWLLVKSSPVRDASGKVIQAISIYQDVTEIKDAELQLARRQDELSVMLRTMESGCTAQSPDGALVYANDAAARMLGFPDADSLIRTDPRRIMERFDVLDESGNPFPPESLPGRLALMGKPVTGTVIGYRNKATGEQRWSLVNATPVLDGQGRVRLCMNVFNDITAMKRAELAVAKHMRYLQGMNQLSGAIEGAQDTERMLPTALAKLLEIFECDRAWLIHPSEDGAEGHRIVYSAERPGRALSEGAAGSPVPAGGPAPGGPAPGVPADGRIPPEADFGSIARDCKATDDPVVYGREKPLPNAAFWKGEWRVGSAKTISVRPPMGQSWILCLLRSPEARPWQGEDFTMFKDIASRIASSLGSLLLNRDMRRSEEKYRTLFERSLDGIFRSAPDGTLLDANPALVSLLGYSDRGHLVGTLRPRLLPAGVEGASEKGETFTVELEREGAAPVWVEVNARPIRRADGKVAYFEGIVRNISDRKRAEDALKASEEKLRQSQKMEAIGRLAGGVAHDFNNLLTAINGFSDLLLMSVPKADSKRIHIEEIRKAGGRAAELTSQLLSFSRKQVLAPRVLDLNAVVMGMETMLRRLIGENIEFATRLAGDLPKVMADPGQMEQIILNLVLNARDAMPDGGVLNVVTGRLKLADDNRIPALVEFASGEYAMLSVADNGTGMDADTRSRLFEPFFTTKSKDKGTGLGLSTVYGAVKQSNGGISVESELGKGTVFSIYLPSASRLEQPEKTRLRQRALRSVGGSETILLVEDEDAVRRLVRDVLEVGGYKVFEAPGGEQALELLETRLKDTPIQLLLTDVVMGGMSGRELAERLQALRPGTKALFMSGYTEDAIIRHGVFTAQAAFIGKPFSPAAISAKVREVLDGAGAKFIQAAQADDDGVGGEGRKAGLASAPDGKPQ